MLPILATAAHGAVTVFQVGLDPTYPTVASAVGPATDGDIIEIHGPGPYVETINVNNEDLTFVGIGEPLLQSSHVTNGFFHIHGDSVASVSGVQLDGRGLNRSLKIDGSAIVSIADSTIVGGWSSQGAGSLFMDQSAEVTVVDTTFDDSFATKSGGAILAQGSGGIAVIGCTFTNNHAGTAGGAIHCKPDSGCQIEDSLFSANESDIDAGAIQFDAPGAPHSITGSRFCGNVASGTGGAILANSQVTVSHSVFGLNVASGNGGGINSTSSLLLYHSDFLKNVSAGQGSAVAISVGSGVAKHDLFVDHISGGEAYYVAGGATATLSYNLYDGNTVPNTNIGDGANAVNADPLFTSWNGADCLNAVLTLEPGSPAIDAGDPAEPDPDGTDPEIGAFGAVCVPTAEVEVDHIDQDCDGGDLCYGDADGDGLAEEDTLVPGDLDCTDAGTFSVATDGCPGYDDHIDADGDTVPDGCDICAKGNDYDDYDGDGIPDACDPNDVTPDSGTTTDTGSPGTTDTSTPVTDTEDPGTTTTPTDDGPPDGGPSRGGAAGPGPDAIGCACDGMPGAGSLVGVLAALIAIRRRER